MVDKYNEVQLTMTVNYIENSDIHEQPCGYWGIASMIGDTCSLLDIYSTEYFSKINDIIKILYFLELQTSNTRRKHEFWKHMKYVTYI